MNITMVRGDDKLFELTFTKNGAAIDITGWTIYCIPVAGVVNILGHSNALGTAQNAGLYVSQTYGALPGTFPASPTMITAAPIPAIFVRLSA